MEDKRKKIIDTIVKIILIIIIIILLIHNCVLNEKRGEEKIPTGNVDIIEITCDNDNKCKVEPKDKDSNGKKNDNGGTSDTSGDVPVSEEEESSGGAISVYDNDVTWQGETEVKIFSNSMYQIDDVIAPESSNTYQFVVKNSADYKIKYNISFSESNPHNINMKYKLKKNDTYIVDHYVSSSELNLTNMLLDSSKNDTYYLEWKWVSSGNDTQVGKTLDAKYGLKINVKAESTNG